MPIEAAQGSEVVGALAELTSHAPVIGAFATLVLACLGFHWKLFRVWIKHEAARDEKVADMHGRWFTHLDKLDERINDRHERMVDIVADTTRALGEVTETNRAVLLALRDQ